MQPASSRRSTAPSTARTLIEQRVASVCLDGFAQPYRFMCAAIALPTSLAVGSRSVLNMTLIQRTWKGAGSPRATSRAGRLHSSESELESLLKDRRERELNRAIVVLS